MKAVNYYFTLDSYAQQKLIEYNRGAINSRKTEITSQIVLKIQSLTYPLINK